MRSKNKPKALNEIGCNILVVLNRKGNIFITERAYEVLR